MQLFIYDKVTKEYIGEMDAYLDPLESKLRGKDIFTIPPQTTPFPPMQCEAGKVNVYNEDKMMWELVEDNRGVVVYNKNGEELQIVELGAIPEGYLLEKPFNLQEAKFAKLDELNKAYYEACEQLVKVGKLTENVDVLPTLLQLQQASNNLEFVVFNSINNGATIISKEELDEASNFYYVRSILLAMRREELAVALKGVRSKAQLDKLVLDFNIDKDIKKLLKMSKEELNKYIKENM